MTLQFNRSAIKLGDYSNYPLAEFVARLFLTCFLLPIASVVHAQMPAFVLDINPVSEQKITELEAKSSVTLRNELRVLDLALFELLNSLIDDEYYTINCKFSSSTNTFIRTRYCDTLYGELASGYVEREQSALDTIGQLPQELLQELHSLPLTELERRNGEYEAIVFALARENQSLAQKLLDRHYVQLVLDHRKENWWRRFFGMRVDPLLTATED